MVPYQFPPYFLRQDLLLHLDPTSSVTAAGQEALGIHVFNFPALELEAYTTTV